MANKIAIERTLQLQLDYTEKMLERLKDPIQRLFCQQTKLDITEELREIKSEQTNNEQSNTKIRRSINSTS